MAGVVPGLLIGALLMVYAIYYCKKHGEDKEKIAAEIDQLHAKGFIGVFKESFFAILSPVIILGCIYTGVASPTEAAVISVFYSLVVSLFIYKSMKFKDIWGINVIRSNATRKQTIKGIAFCAIFITGISVKDDATNKLTPIGGVTKPMARFTTIITPK